MRSLLKKNPYLEGREGGRGKKSNTWTKMVILKIKTITNFVQKIIKP